MTRLSSRLPKGEPNGLDAIARDLIAEPHRAHIVIAVVDCSKIVTDVDAGDPQPTARIRRIERVITADLPHAEQLLRRALEKRSGMATLPLDLEDEITQIFTEAAGTGELPDEDGTA